MVVVVVVLASLGRRHFCGGRMVDVLSKISGGKYLYLGISNTVSFGHEGFDAGMLTMTDGFNYFERAF